MGHKKVLIISAVLVAALGAALVVLYVRGIESRAEAAQRPVNVLTATARIEAGERMADAQADGKVDLEAWPTSKVMPTALGSATGMEDQVALTAILPGEQIVAEKFGDVGEQEVLNIPRGMMAVSVQLTDPARVAGFVNPGSEVAVFVTGEPELTRVDGSTLSLPGASKLLLRRVEVIGVGHTSTLSTTSTEDGEETTEEVPQTILTVAVSQDEAEEVFLAQTAGELSFALLTDDSKTQETPGTVVGDLFAGTYPGVL